MGLGSVKSHFNIRPSACPVNKHFCWSSQTIDVWGDDVINMANFNSSFVKRNSEVTFTFFISLREYFHAVIVLFVLLIINRSYSGIKQVQITESFLFWIGLSFSFLRFLSFLLRLLLFKYKSISISFSSFIIGLKSSSSN